MNTVSGVLRLLLGPARPEDLRLADRQEAESLTVEWSALECPTSGYISHYVLQYCRVDLQCGWWCFLTLCVISLLSVITCTSNADNWQTVRRSKHGFPCCCTVLRFIGRILRLLQSHRAISFVFGRPIGKLDWVGWWRSHDDRLSRLCTICRCNRHTDSHVAIVNAAPMHCVGRQKFRNLLSIYRWGPVEVRNDPPNLSADVDIFIATNQVLFCLQ